MLSRLNLVGGFDNELLVLLFREGKEKEGLRIF